MHFSTLLLPALLTAFTSATPDTQSKDVFHVTKFQTICTEAAAQHTTTTAILDNFCYSNFNVSLNNSPSVHCDVEEGKSKYKFCGVIDPEQAFYAYIAPSKAGSRTLHLKFTTAIVNHSSTEIGTKVLKQYKPNFTVPVSAVHTNASD